MSSLFASSQKAHLPVEKGAAGSKDVAGQRAPIRQQQWGVTAAESERFVVQDKNGSLPSVVCVVGTLSHKLSGCADSNCC